MISLPNILLALFNGVLIDRYGPARVTLWAAAIGFVGAVLTAIGTPYGLMWAGRFVFGISEGAIFISLMAGIAQWFSRSGIAVAAAVFLSLARVGSYSLDKSPTGAPCMKPAGSRRWLSAAITAPASAPQSASSCSIRCCPRKQYARSPPSASGGRRCEFSSVVLVHPGLRAVRRCVLPVRQTAIEYLQHVKGLTLQQAGTVNSGVFATAVFATPLFGLLADRLGHRALMLTVGTVLLPITFVVLSLTDLPPWVSTALMGVSFSLVPAIIWPATTLIVDPRRLGTALGVITLLQNVGLWGSNRVAGWLADQSGAGPANPAGYGTMIWFFGLLSLTALTSALLLWQRESGARGHGLELARFPAPAHAELR